MRQAARGLFIHRSELRVTVNQTEVEQGGNCMQRQVLEAKPGAGMWGESGFCILKGTLASL